MLPRQQRINAFASLGQWLENLSPDEWQFISDRTRAENPWFTEQNVRSAVTGIIAFLKPDVLSHWASRYPVPHHAWRVGIVMAGNIPMVGFHDLLAVIVSGHSAYIKLSSKDQFLIRYVTSKLIEFDPALQEHIVFVEQLKNFDAVIATGSDNSSRYFEYYFGKYPSIIRKNRTSVAVLSGDETTDDLKRLAEDVFLYFGLGCRNVSKLFVPRGYALAKVLDAWEGFHDIIHHHKYCNNYDYQKSILLVNSMPFLDNGFVMLQESERLVSPISVIFYEFYDDAAQLNQRLTALEDKIQCIVGHAQHPARVQFGYAQHPAIDDYADRVDTMKFLCELE